MSTRILYLFPDTNLFIQCRPLDQLDWTEWKEFEEVHLFVSRPVQSEIDHQKNKGGDRVGRRARAASSMFREIILGSEGCKEIRPSGPTVKLFIKPELRRSEELAERLDYNERDDQLVGTAYEFKFVNPICDVAILTHDTGPMASARMVGITVFAISEQWLVPPEATESERKITALQNELTRLKKTEPEFEIVCLDDENNQVSALEFERIHYQQLTDQQLKELLGRITSYYPRAADFGAREPEEREINIPGFRIPGMKEFFTPASDEEISTYEREKYPGWLSSCEKTLSGCNQILQERIGRLKFKFSILNSGARPAKDALITFEAKGSIEIAAPSDANKGKKADAALELPLPPTPPRGQWQSGIASQRHALAELSRMQSLHLEGLGPFGREAPSLRDFHMPVLPKRRDPNEFYYKDKPRFPEAQFSLECAQWRHGVEPESFSGEIHYDFEEERIVGALECRIHAENLSNVVSMVVPIRIKVTHTSSYEVAKELVDFLILRKGRTMPWKSIQG